MKVSQACVDLVKKYEGCELTAYLDTLATTPVWTIGYGHTGPDVYEGLTITQEEAESLLLDRLNNKYGPAVERALDGAPTMQAQFDAMTSLTYNIGPGSPDRPDEGGFMHSSICRKHKSGDYKGAADAFLLYNKSGGAVRAGLVRRRKAERSLYLSQPIEPAKPANRIFKIEQAIKAHNRESLRLQKLLLKYGFDPGPTDGDWGERSRRAKLEYLRKVEEI